MGKGLQSKKIRVLYVDDEMSNLNSFKASFRRDFDVFVTNSPAEGLKILMEEEIHVILSDQRMPEITGVELLESAFQVKPDVPRIIVTGYTDVEDLIDAINRARVFRFIRKPWAMEEIKAIITDAYEMYSERNTEEEETRSLKKQNQQLEFILSQMMLD